MSIAIVEEIGVALASEISGAPWDVVINTPAFSYADWDLALESMDGIYVDVVPVSTEYQVQEWSREKFRHTVPFDIAIRKKFAPDDRDSGTNRIKTESMRPLVYLWQQMFEFFQPTQNGQSGFQLVDVADSAWESTSPTAIWVRRHLHEMGQYTGLIRLTFTVDRKPSTA